MQQNAMPLLPLEYFRQFLQANPYHFWGLSGPLTPISSGCNGLLREYAWQSADQLARSDVRNAIAEAERKIKERLGYAVAPQYGELTLPFPRPAEATFRYRASIGTDGRWIALKLPGEGHIQALGVETLTLISANVAVTYSDANNDGLNDTFTLSAATTVTDPTQIAVYFNATDRYDGSGAGYRWRVHPVRVSISAGTVTIKGPSWMLVKPVLYEGVLNTVSRDSDGLAPTDTTNFVTSLDIYRRYTNGGGTTNETAQGLMTWETAPWPSWACCADGSSTDNSSDPASIATAVARVGIRNAEYGLVIPGEAAYNTDTGIWASASWDGCRQPDRITVRYLAGFPNVASSTSADYLQMDPTWREVVCKLAVAELTCPTKACDDLKRILSYWQTDLARTDNAQGTFAISAEDLNNPFGTKRGQVEAWKRVSDAYHAVGITPG